jgi:Ca2+-binding EF-hand superfamily protein
VIPLEEIPSLFRAVGFYPSEDEVQNVINEVRYKHFVNTGETQEYVGLV